MGFCFLLLKTSNLETRDTNVLKKRPGKSLRQLSQTIQGVEVGALPISSQRLAVQLDTIDCLQTGDIKIAEGETETAEDNSK